jgi:hypothetical protein
MLTAAKVISSPAPGEIEPQQRRLPDHFRRRLIARVQFKAGDRNVEIDVEFSKILQLNLDTACDGRRNGFERGHAASCSTPPARDFFSSLLAVGTGEFTGLEVDLRLD